MTTGTQAFDVKIKAVGPEQGLGVGEFVALVSVFYVPDRIEDVVMPGAFADSLAQWAAKGDPIPVIWSHDWADPFAHLGRVLKAEETPEGLLVHGIIDDMDTNPTALQVYKLLKGRRVTQFSFAYDTLDAEWGQIGGRDVYLLKRLELREVGPCLLGVHPDTQLLAVKSHALLATARAGLLDAKAAKSLTEARENIDGALAAYATATAADAAAEVDAAAAAAAQADQTSPAGVAEVDTEGAEGAAGVSDTGQQADDTEAGSDAASSTIPPAPAVERTPAQDIATLELMAL